MFADDVIEEHNLRQLHGEVVLVPVEKVVGEAILMEQGKICHHSSGLTSL